MLFVAYFISFAFYRISPYMGRNKYRRAYACGSFMSWHRFPFLLGLYFAILKTFLRNFNKVLGFLFLFKKKILFQDSMKRLKSLVIMCPFFFSAKEGIFHTWDFKCFKFLLKNLRTMKNTFHVIYASRLIFCFAEMNVLINI